MLERVVSFASEPGFWTGHWRNIAVQIWGGEVTVDHVDRCGECNHVVLRAHPEALVTVAIVLPTANPKVGSAVRERVQRLARAQRGITLAAAQIVDGTGFWASTVRAVLTGFNMLSQTRQRVFDTDMEAARWLVSDRLVDAPTAGVEVALAGARQLYVGH